MIGADLLYIILFHFSSVLQLSYYSIKKEYQNVLQICFRYITLRVVLLLSFILRLFFGECFFHILLFFVIFFYFWHITSFVVIFSALTFNNLFFNRNYIKIQVSLMLLILLNAKSLLLPLTKKPAYASQESSCLRNFLLLKRQVFEETNH